MTSPESPLWDYLDACGLGFRLTRQRLINHFGFQDCGWTVGLFTCFPKVSKPFFPGLSLFFQFQEHTDKNARAGTWFGHIRSGSDYSENYQIALSNLTDLFGEGQDASSSSNTRSRRWEFGFASIVATVFPPHKNTRFPPNARHEKIPGSAEECTVTIIPAWRDPLGETGLAWLKTYIPLLDSQPARAAPMITPNTTDWPANMRLKTCGFGVSADNSAIIHIPTPGLVTIIPRHWMTSLGRFSLLPARGPGEASISVYYYPHGNAENPIAFVSLAEQVGDPAAFNLLAQGLAKRLGLALSEQEMLNT